MKISFSAMALCFCLFGCFRSHHFQPTGQEGVMYDTTTGMECSARRGMIWTKKNQRTVWDAGTAAQKARKEYADYVGDLAIVYGGTLACDTDPRPNRCPPAPPVMYGLGSAPPAMQGRVPVEPVPPPGFVPLLLGEEGSECFGFKTNAEVKKCNALYEEMNKLDNIYNADVEIANSEKVLGSASAIPDLPLCRDL